MIKYYILIKVSLYKNKEQLRIDYFITQQKIGTNINSKK